MSADVRERFADLDADAFARLIARTWREYDWAVVEPSAGDLPEAVDDPTAPIEGGTVLLARSTERRLVLTVPGGERLSATALLGVLSAVDAPEQLMVVAAGGFDTGALSVADAYGVDLVGPAALARLRDSVGEDRIDP